MTSATLKSLAVGLLAFAGAAHASLIMNVYAGAGLDGIAGAKTAIARNGPTLTTTAELVDFYNGIDSAGSYGYNFAFPGAGRSVMTHNFAVVFSGALDVAASGIYDFRSLADDGVELAIDDRILFSDPSYHYPQYFSGSTFLEAGRHRISFLYLQGWNGATVELEARPANGSYALLGSTSTLKTRAIEVPEPATLGLVALALGVAGGVARRKR